MDVPRERTLLEVAAHAIGSHVQTAVPGARVAPVWNLTFALWLLYRPNRKAVTFLLVVSYLSFVWCPSAAGGPLASRPDQAPPYLLPAPPDTMTTQRDPMGWATRVDGPASKI